MPDLLGSWRPEGWVTLTAKHHPLHCFWPDECVGQSYEAGATAMLEALKAGGKKIPLGWQVFIPEAQE